LKEALKNSRKIEVHYRNLIHSRFSRINIKFRHSNISVGFREDRIEKEKITSLINNKIKELYIVLEDYIAANPEFKKTHIPWNTVSGVKFIDKMIEYSREAGVGPMAAVAGAFADELVSEIFDLCGEIWIENGGDITLKSKKESRVCLYPGWGHFEQEIYLKIPPGSYGIASSSGRFGYSFSKGKAELVTVVAENATKADAFATTICNRIIPGCNPENILENYNQLKSVTVIWQEKLYHKGEIELDFN
jgi:ApbE superfamily uncharacterized protein (UPF0280 family)